MKEEKRIIPVFLVAVYIFIILYITCLNRITSFSSQIAPYPFWSYVTWFSGNWKIGIQIIENILLFIPLGFLLSSYDYRKCTVLCIAAGLSLCIETAQLLFHLGLFEFDDIFNNVLGAAIGIFIIDKIKLSNKTRIMISSVVVLAAVVFCISMEKPEKNNVCRDYYFGIRNVLFEDGVIRLDGNCFSYDNPDEEYGIFLKNDKETIPVDHVAKLSSEDINEYFTCNKDYVNTGFSATAEIKTNKTYEILIKWDNGVTTETNTYIKNSEIVYTLNPAPDFDGTLLVARPEHDFYVFQRDSELYWLCGEAFPFEGDGSIYIQYQLWTTQIEKLPEHRLANDWFWDNIGFNFEDYEIETYGNYRVAVRPLPTEYSITSIVTGYHKDGKWIWKDYFRPVISELMK